MLKVVVKRWIKIRNKKTENIVVVRFVIRLKWAWIIKRTIIIIELGQQLIIRLRWLVITIIARINWPRWVGYWSEIVRTDKDKFKGVDIY